MIAVYAPEHALLARLPGPSLLGQPVRCSQNAADFERARLDATCAVLLVDDLAGDPVFPTLTGMRERGGVHPMVVATRKTSGNLRLLAHASPGEVVWLHEMERMLAPAVHRACSAGHLQHLSLRLEALAEVAPRLRDSLAHACRSPLPVTSVGALARMAGCDRSTLFRQWKRATEGAAAPLRLEDFLDWILVLRAAGLRTPGRKWAAIAAELGVHEKTLARTARRVTGLSLREVSAGKYDALVVLFSGAALSALDATERPPMHQTDVVS